MGWAVESRQRLACLARSELGSSLRMSRNMADAVLFQPCAGRAEFAEQLRRRESLFGELTKRESALATAGVPFTLAGWCAVCERNTEFLLLSELRGSGWRSVALHLYASENRGYLGGPQFLLAARRPPAFPGSLFDAAGAPPAGDSR